MTTIKNLTTIILAGGKSSRMGYDKGLALINNRPMISYLLEQSKKFANTTLIITNQEGYGSFDCLCFTDEWKEKGPLGGIHAGLLHSSTTKNLVLSCDTPFISSEIINELIRNCGNEDVLVAEHGGFMEPLCAIYDQRCLPFIEKALTENRLKITDVLNEMNMVRINFDIFGTTTKKTFANINTPEELKEYQSTHEN